MKILVSGGNGTVGSALVQLARSRHHEVIVWNRHKVPYEDTVQVRQFLEETRPHAFVNLAISSSQSLKTAAGVALSPSQINIDLPAMLATECRKLGIRFCHTSSVMVFEESGQGPFSTSSTPKAASGYGAEKRLAEEKLLSECPEAIVARLGWQIGLEASGNTMTKHLSEKMNTEGKISASTKWLPACSFTSDTAACLLSLLNEETAGEIRIAHIEGNLGWNFFEIVSALNALLGESWNIVPEESFVFDQRLIGNFNVDCDLSKRLPTLGRLG